jgi:large subunit ribosomal protein L18
MSLSKSSILLQKRRWRIRKKINGTAQRPRLVVTFTNKHVYAQCIDDQKGQTLVYLSTSNKNLSDRPLHPNLEGATFLGKILAEKAKASGIVSVVFDRAGRSYHGCVKAFAEAAREGGLVF